MEGSSIQIVSFPHPTLRHKSKPVRRVDAELVQIVREMFRLMYANNGIGLAANQVDLPLRLFIVNLSAKPDEGEEFVFINPVLSKPKGNEEFEEGCLSFPELYGPVTRPKQITVQAYNLRGEEIRMNLDGMLARVIQHEYDHLDGTVFVDRMTPTARAKAQPMLDEFELGLRALRQTGAVPGDDVIASRLAQWEQRYA
ncbi:MAG: peptide deformylase [Candidatus Anammoximicrobium sp.]|nr:peptide deformylase [Candidatus Anammoximicrobium sp.]